MVRASEILDVVRDPGLRELLEYWISVHPGDRLPSRRHIDPVDVMPLLRSVALTDVERNPIRFRVRLMGTAVMTAFGRDLTGSYLHEALPGFEESSTYAKRVDVTETGLPVHCFGPPDQPFKLCFPPAERLYLPLAADGRNVDMILTMTKFMADAAALSPFAPRMEPTAVAGSG